MTDRLYYTDAQLTEFEARVIACAPTHDGYEVSLDATAFYPTGGGQPHDAGSLGDRAVLDVIDRDTAGIAHVLDGPLELGARVRGIIDWPRRLDHMQQHTGQHILSAAFESVGRAATTSFHLGTASSTIDLGRVVSSAEITAAEDAANRIVWQDREVRLRFTSPAEAGTLPLRKETGREGTLRLVEVDGFDLSACGGTHVARTGVVGIVSIAGWEKFKGGTRVEFLCGGRALARLREWRDVFSATSRVLSVLPAGLASAIERLQGENKGLGRTVRDLQARLAAQVAADFVSTGPRGPDGRVVVVRTIDGWDALGLKAIAIGAAASPGVCAVLFSGASPFLAVVARASDVRIDAAAVLAELIGRFGGKGGGKPEFAQGGGLTGDAGEITGLARSLLGG